MNAQQIVETEGFAEFAMIEAIKFISEKTGITVKSLLSQFRTNKKLQEECAKLAAELAKELASI